jgi:hypothetical protein
VLSEAASRAGLTMIVDHSNKFSKRMAIQLNVVVTDREWFERSVTLS